ncbi:MAG: type II toxin-antitoxin system PemK/MazF family toxin [Thermoanaerobacterales bacterium]|nr:type II toxin-antitoxin system PemK/MazF family toxin [Thermoanaerobacterales bacterium]
MNIKRGDVFLVNFNPARGSEQAGYRPAVVIQNNVGNRHGSTTLTYSPCLKAGDSASLKDACKSRSYSFSVKS